MGVQTLSFWGGELSLTIPPDPCHSSHRSICLPVRPNSPLANITQPIIHSPPPPTTSLSATTTSSDLSPLDGTVPNLCVESGPLPACATTRAHGVWRLAGKDNRSWAEGKLRPVFRAGCRPPAMWFPHALIRGWWVMKTVYIDPPRPHPPTSGSPPPGA